MKLTEEVLAVLSTCEVKNNTVFITGGQLNRKLYLKVNEALEAIGGKWSRKIKGHEFAEDHAEDRLEMAILTGEVERAEDFDFFPTPEPLAKQMIHKNLKGKQVLEPSAGEGAIVSEIMAVGGRPWCVEINKHRCSKLEKLVGIPDGGVVVCGDFLKVSPRDPFGPNHGNFHLGPEKSFFDAVAMNPPFSKRQDILHVQHAIKFLRSGGRLVSVMSAGVLFRQDKLTTAFLHQVALQGGEFTKLPEGSFKSSGTNVNAVLLEMQIR